MQEPEYKLVGLRRTARQPHPRPKFLPRPGPLRQRATRPLRADD